MTGIDYLVGEWRREAERIRSRYGAEDLAKLCETHAVELEAAITAAEEEELDLTAAAAESGYSVSQLRRLFPAGTVRRRDLPRKPRRGRVSETRTLPVGNGGVSQKEEVSEDVAARLDAHFARSAARG